MRHIKLPSPTNHPKTRKTTTPVWGYILLVTTFLLYLISMYAIVVSKLMPDTGNYYLDAIKHDWYYCFLSPVTLIFVGFIFVYLNWFSMKFFRHNA